MTVHRTWWTAFAGTLSLLVCLAVATPNRTAAAAATPAATAPTVTINQASFQADPTKGSLIYFTVRFSAQVTGFTAGDVSLAGTTTPGDLAVFSSGSGASYTVWVGGMTGPGTVIASIPAGVARDAVNTSNLASTSTDNTVTYKPLGPTVTINQGAGQADPTNASPIVFDVMFSSSVSGFDASDVSFAGSTVGGSPAAQVSGSGANYTVSVTGMAGKGTLFASIPAGAAKDSSNRNNFASTSTDNAVAFDKTSPSVTINQAAGQADPALTSPIVFTIIFSEPVSGLTSSDISFTGSTAGGTLAGSLSGGGQTYTLSVTGMTTSGTVVASIPAGAATDSVGNPSTASSSTDNTVTYSSAPTVTINQAATQPDPTSAAPISFAVVFSLPVTGFSGSDISFAGSTVGGTLVASVTGSATNYTVSVTGMTGSGTVMASVPAGAAVDAANKPNVASTSIDNSVGFDTVAPTVTINRAATQNDPTGTSPIVFAVTFSEPVTGFTAADVSLAGSTAGGSLAASVTGSGANYAVSVAGMTSSGNVVIGIPAGAAVDLVGNASQTPTLLDNTIAFDNLTPTVTIDQAVSQSDPTASSPVVFAVTFSEPVSGFSGSDLSFAGSTAGAALMAAVTGSGASYTVSVSGMTTPGTVVANIPPGAAQDAAGNSSQGSTSTDNTVAFDNVAPTVVINQSANQADPTAGTPILFTVTFSEAVTGFSADDVSLVDSTVGGALQKAVTGSGANYSVSVSGMSGSGAVIARVNTGAASDAAGNSSGASTSTDNTVTYLPTGPAVTINQGGLQPDPTSTAPIAFAVVFSTPVTGFDGSDISFAGSTAPGALTASVSGSGANYTVTVTGMTGAGVVTATIPAGAAFDGANNPNQASTSVDNQVTFDSVSPTVTINQAGSQADPTNSSPIAFTVIFSEPVNGFNAADVSLAGSTAGNALSASVSGSGANYTVSVSGMTASGVVVISIAAGAATDAVGNASAASTSADNSVTFDNLGPTVTVNQAVTQTDPASTSPIRFAVEFSEAVVGFTSGDVSFAGSTVGGTLTASVSGSGASYAISVTGMTGNGTVLVTIPAGAATDLVGNATAVSTSSDNVVSFIALGPTVTINQMPGPVGRAGQPDPTNTAPISFSVVFSAPVTGFTGADVSFIGSTVGGSPVANVSGSGASYTVSVTGISGNGTVVASIPADAAVDSAGAGNRASTSTDNSVTFDTTPPTVTINQAAAQIDPTSVSPIQFTVTFSEPVVGFNATDVSLAGSTNAGTLVASVTGSGATYTVSVSGMSGTGTVLASVPAAAAKDAAGNNSLASTSSDNVVTYGTTGPSVTINQAGGQPDPTNASPIQFTVVFSAPVTGFTGADLNFAGSTAAGTLVANVAGTGALYTVSVTGMAGTGTVVASIPAGAAIDAASNVSAASSSTDNVVSFDNVAPTVTINQAAGQNDPTNFSTIAFTVVFSEPVTGFTGSDVSLAGSTVGGTPVANVSGSGANYTVSVTGIVGSGMVVASIPAGAAIDAAANASSASTSTDNTVTRDTVGPTVTINQASTQSDPTNASPIQFTVVFSEPVFGFTAADVSFAGSTVGGTLVATIAGSGPTYTVSVTGMTGTGVVVATIVAQAVGDGAGNENGISTSTDNSVTYNATGPTVTINQDVPRDPTNASLIVFGVVFSAPVTGFTAADVSFAGSTVGGTLVANVSASPVPGIYDVAVTGMSGTGTVVASIPAGAATDALGNPSQASTSTDNTVTFDNVAPTVTINQAAGQADPANTSPIQFTVVFSESVTGFTGSDVSLAGSTVGGTLVANVTGGATTYTVSVTGMTGSGNVVASIPAGAATDDATNTSTASSTTDNSVTYTVTGPSVTINQAAGQVDPTNASPIQFTVVFSAPVTGFTSADVSFAGSTLPGLTANVAGSGASYTVSVTGMTGTGTVVAAIPAGAAVDAIGNSSQASTTTDNTVTFDNVAPTVTINQATTQTDPANISPVVFTVVFSEPVSGFSTGDVLLTGSTVGGTLIANVSGSGSTYAVSVTGMTGTGTVVASIPAAAANDAAGNPNAGSTSTDNSVTFNNVAPAVAINQAAAQADPTNTSPVVFTVVFSAPVTGFTSADVNLIDSTAPGTLTAAVTGSGTTYTVSVSGMTAPGTVVASIPAGAAIDAANNPSQASSSVDNVITFDNVVPTVTINQAAGQADPTNASPILFSVVFSEPVINFTASDVSFAGSTVGGTLAASISGSGANYTVSVTGMSGSGTVVANIPASGAADPAGNPNQTSTSTDNSVAYNAIAPAVTINQAATQTDPTNAAPIVFTVLFSAPVTGFTGSDISFTGSTAPGTLVASVTGSGGAYTVSVTGMTGSGTVQASVPAGAAQDAASNSSQASTSTDNTVTYDTVPPTVTINQATGQADPTNTSPILFTVTFSEPVTGFTSSDVSLTGSTVGGTLVANVGGSGANYTVSVTGMSGVGTVVANIPGNAASDLAGNGSGTSTSTDNTVTYNATGPTVTINQAAGQPDPTNASPIQFTVIFSAPVTGFTASDVSFVGSTLSGLVAGVTGSGATYTVSVTGMTGTGSVVASIAASAATDTIGNLSAASTSVDNTVAFDNVPPTVTINQAAGQSDPTNTSPVVFAVLFSESVTGFTSSDVSLNGSTVGGTLVADVSGTGASYTVSVTGMSGTGTVVASIPGNGAVDAAGNPNVTSTSTDNTVTYNAIAPSVTINQAVGQADPTGTAPILFTVVFSAPVTGFTSTDISFTGSTAPGVAATVTGSGTTYTLSVAGMSASGTVVVNIPGGAASDLAGNLNQASTSTDNTVTYDVSGPRVVSASPSGTVGGPIDRITLAFNEAIQVSTFTLADIVSLTGPGGAIAATAVNALNAQTFEVVFASQTSGTFTLVIGPDIRDVVDNPMDQNGNGINGEATADRYTTSFTIAGAATLTSVTPSSGQQGQTNLDVVVTAQSSHFVNGVTTAGFSGNGISVNSVTVTTPSSATLNIDISPIAILDQRSVTLTTNTEVVSSASAGTFFTVTASPATIASITPDHARQGETLTVTVTGFATHFATGSTNVSFGAGITVNSFSVAGATSLSANITIHPSADVGLRTVTITTGGESATASNLFTVNQGDPAVTNVAPATGRQAETLSVVVDAVFTHFTANTQPDFGPGITVNSIVPASATQATVNITIDHDAAPGARTVVMRTGLEQAQKVGGFTVLEGLARLKSITPVAAVQGTSGTLIVNGDFTHFIQGGTNVSLGTGITLGTVTVNGPALLSVPFNVSEAAGLGPRDVVVATGTEVVTLTDGFAVIQGEPGVTIINPNAGQRGITLNVSLTGHFTNWVNGVTHVTYGAGVTVNSNVVSGPTLITTNITIDANATLGPRNVTVTTNTEVLTVFGGFTVNDVDITAPAIVTVSPANGTVDVPLNVVPTIEMSEPLDRSSVNTASVMLYDGFLGQFVPTTVTLDVTGRIITIVPTQLLAVSRGYTLYIGWFAGIRDVAGNQFGGTVYSCTTGFATDTTGPTLVVINPPNGDTGVPVNTALALKFDRPINAAARAAGLQILRAGLPVAGTFTFAEELRRINFAPAVPLDANTTYTIALSAGLIDLAGNSLTNPGNRTFTTGTATDTTGPTVIAYSPLQGDTNVGLHPIIRVTFSEPINPMTLTPSTFYLYNYSLGVFVPTTMTIAPDRRSATLTPVGNLNPFTLYLFYAASFYDVAGNFGGGPQPFFTTGDASDATPPTVVVATPAVGTTNVPVNALVQVTLSEPIDQTSIDSTTLQLTPAAAGTVTLLSDRKTIKLTLAGSLAPSTAYALTVSGARDAAGNVMTPFSGSFTTSPSSASDTTGPVVLSVTPTSGSTNVPLDATITMTVSEPIDPSHVGPNSMSVYVNNGSLRADGTYVISSDGTSITFTPALRFPTNSVVYVYSNADSSITDLANNPLQYTFSSFTTASTPADTTAPTVVSVTPNDGTVDVGPLATVTLTFSEAITSSIDAYRTFGMFAGGVPQAISISHSADNRMIFLTGSWPLNTVMTVVATADATDLAGNHLAPFSSTFKTAGSFDPNRPYVVTQLPTGSSVDRTTPITLYVSKPLNTATVQNAVYVSQNGVLVDGTIRTSGGGTAINFTPAASFAPNAVVQIFVTAAAQDTFGNAMTPFSGSFTIAPDTATAAPVIVRTSPGMGSINNPLNSIVETEFSEPLNPATVTTTNYGVFLLGTGTAIPGTLSLRNGNRTIRFVPETNLQAGVYYYVFLQAGLQDAQGTPFAATNYYFYLGTDTDTTTPTVTAVAPVSGSVNVGINAAIRVTFSEPISPLSVTPGSVTLSTPAGPVPVTLTLANNNTTVRLTPQSPLPANTQVTVFIDPYDVAGHDVPVVQAQFTTGGAADTVPASVVSASWTPSQASVPTNSVLQIVLSEPMDVPSVLAQQPFFLYDWRLGTYVDGILTAQADARTFTFTPASPLAVNRTYSAQLSSAFDLAGNFMSGFQAFFTTALVSDTIAPTVVGVNPLNGAGSVPRNAKIRVLFDEPIATNSVTDVKLLRNGIPVTVSAATTNGTRLVTLTPSGLLAPNSVYTVSAQVRDTSGNVQAALFVSTFTTGNDVDLIAPTVVATSPSYGQTGVPLNTIFRVAFSEPIDPLTIDPSSFYLSNVYGQPPIPVSITVAADRRSVLLTPTQPLLPYSQYLGNLYNYSDSAGNVGAGTGIYFVTGDAVDVTAPVVSTIAPPNGANNVAVNPRVVVVMSEPIDSTSVSSSIQLTPSIQGTVALAVDQVTLTFTPATLLSPSTAYTITVSGLRDLTGHVMSTVTSSFTTSASSTADTTPPTVVSMTPVNGAAGIAVNSSIVMVSSEPIVRSTVGSGTMPVYAQIPIYGYVQVAGTYSVDSTNTIITFTPTSPFPANTTVLWYTNYTSQITDFAGNPLTYLTPQFTTGSEADVTGPTLLTITPTDGATGLGPFTTMTLTFSESVSPATINESTLALFNGATRVGVSIARSLDNRMVFLGTTLLPDTTYTIVGTSEIRDLSGNAFAGFTSSFTTAPFDVSRPSIVTQRPTGSGVRPTTSITLYVDTPLNPATVPGATFVAQNGVLVPGTVTVSGGGRVVLFTPAAPFASNAIVEIFITENATDPSRNPIFAYYGQFLVAADPATAAPTVVQTNPIAGTVDNPQNSVVDVEFSEPLNPATVTDGSFGVYLFGVGSPIAGTRSLRNGNRTIHFVPDPQTPLQAGAYYYVYLTSDITDATGTALTATNFYFYVGTTSDTSALAAPSLAPSQNASGVGMNALGIIRFSEPINPTTINSTTVTLSAGAAVPFVLSHIDNKTFYVTPQAPLPASTAVTLAVNGAEDIAGHAAPSTNATFTTGPIPDTVRPSIVAINPVYSSTNVPVNAVLQMTFDEAMDPGGIPADLGCALYDYPTIGCIAGGTASLSADGRVWTYVPATNLQPGHTYFFGPSGNLLDLAGNPLNAFSSFFVTSSETDTVAPQVLAVSPPSLSGVPRNAIVEVIFNEPIRPTTIGQVNVLVAGSPLPIAARTLSNANRTLTIALTGLLAANTVHTVSIAGISDVAGNVMPTTTSSFTTGNTVDLTPPSTSVTFTPKADSINVPINASMRIQFSESMSPVRAMTFGVGSGLSLLFSATSQAVPFTVSFEDDYRTMVITPTAPLQLGTQYTVGVFFWETDFAGNLFPTAVAVNFTTATQ